MTYTLGMLALAVFAVTGVVAGGRRAWIFSPSSSSAM